MPVSIRTLVTAGVKLQITLKSIKNLKPKPIKIPSKTN